MNLIGTPVTRLEDIENVIWYGKNEDRKDRYTQWMQPEFQSVWDKSLQEALRISGRRDELRRIYSGADAGTLLQHSPNLSPVKGYKNSVVLRNAIIGACDFYCFDRQRVEDGWVIAYVGEGARALKEWKDIAEIAEQATVKFWATVELHEYLQGIRGSYTKEVRRYYCRSNTVTVSDEGADLIWSVDVSGYKFTVSADWDETRRDYRRAGRTLLDRLKPQMEQTVLNHFQANN